MTEAPLALLQVTIEDDRGQRATGLSSDLLVPKWFAKNPDSSIDEDQRDLIQSIDDACDTLLENSESPRTLFDHFWGVYGSQVAALQATDSQRLVRGFGVALVERAMLDAICHLADLPFHEAIRSNLPGIRLDEVDTALTHWDPSSLPTTPSSTIGLRHTVGLLDAIWAADVPEEDRIGDGLPESLEEDIEAGKLQWFKLKINGDQDGDVERLRTIASLLMGTVGESAKVTIDGNEQYDSMASLLKTLEATQSSDEGRWLLERLICIEQPLGRTVTFDPDRVDGIDRVQAIAPVIIDESDHGIDAFPAAVAMGYRGVSIKNCKGVIRAIINRARCDLGPPGLMQTAEDLTNLPIVALQQDLCTASTLGMTHIERNGHHYFKGLDHLPASLAENAATMHDDLYAQHDGSVCLSITHGQLALGSIHGPGYGYRVTHDLDTWSLPHGHPSGNQSQE
jgi:hypothetical protein